jgi:hypothetical protein
MRSVHAGPAKKRAVRVTGRSLGRISPEGLQKRQASQKEDKAAVVYQAKLDQLGKIVVKEYGISYFIEQHLRDYVDQLKIHFPDYWQALISLAYCRLLFQSFIRQMPFHIGHSYLSEQYNGPTPGVQRIGEVQAVQFLAARHGHDEVDFGDFIGQKG